MSMASAILSQSYSFPAWPRIAGCCDELTPGFRSRKMLEDLKISGKLRMTLSQTCQLLIFAFTATDVVLDALGLPSPADGKEIALKCLCLQQRCHLLTRCPHGLHDQLNCCFGPALALGSASLSCKSFCAAISGFWWQ